MSTGTGAPPPPSGPRPSSAPPPATGPRSEPEPRNTMELGPDTPGAITGPYHQASPLIPLGPFRLVAPIARGGMGEIWRGEHTVQGVPVAVKLLTAKTLRQPRFAKIFRVEAQAMAGLSHPGVVQIFDYGEVSAETETASAGRLRAGSPYLVMDLVSGGSMADAPLPTTWVRCRDLLVGLLDALAHAHAHGVIHRDLKPGNVLLTEEGSVKLADFGIAHPLETPAADGPELFLSTLAGTPEYMAPEQCHGHHRDFGPWTDLYALGCLAWWMLTGRVPFHGPSPLATLSAQIQEPLPAFEPRLAVPAGVEAWLRDLLARAPQARFQRAADAAWALFRLATPHGDFDAHAATHPGGTVGLTSAWGATEISGELPHHKPDRGAPPAWRPTGDPVASFYQGSPAVEGGTGQPAMRPPCPPRGEDTRLVSVRPDLLGAGLGLFDLRSVPLVGRGGQRDALWAALQEVEAEAGARAIVLRGAAGTGKSRLADWLMARAHETGVAVTLRAVHGPTSPPTEPLADMMRRHLRVVGLPRAEIALRLAPILERLGATQPGEAAALLEVVSPLGASERGPAAAVRFQRASERHRAIAGHLARLTVERPVVVWLDDVQWGLDALDFVRFCLSDPDTARLPLLFVLTAREEDLAGQRDESRLLQALLDEYADGARVTTERDAVLTSAGSAGRFQSSIRAVEVPPLPPAEHAELIRRLLVLDAGLVRTLADRTAGNPLFAVQLVRAWVQRRWLLLGPLGFHLTQFS